MAASRRDRGGEIDNVPSPRVGSLSRVIAALLGLVTLLWLMWVLPWPRAPLTGRSGPALASAVVWGYQLQRFDHRTIPPEVDMLVVDYSRDGSEGRELTSTAVEELRRRPGKSRIVLAYLSVGEAESYRFYWRNLWSVLPPTWLGPENSAWKGNYPVRFWEPEWQNILLQPRMSVLQRVLEMTTTWRKAYVDRILEAGFDGIYLDRIDSFDDWKSERPDAKRDMVALVMALSRYAKQRRPGFLVVPQNGEELLSHSAFLAAIDGVAKEGLMFGVDGPEQRNASAQFLRSLQLLNRAKARGMPVFVVEYLADAAKRAEASARMLEVGFRLTFATRELNQPPEGRGSNQ